MVIKNLIKWPLNGYVNYDTEREIQQTIIEREK
jgi:hypothetical protein